MFSPTAFRTMAPNLDEVLGVRREMDRWLDRVYSGATQTLQPWAPVVDVRETTDEVIVVAELPGIDPADVNVTVQNGTLTISGEKKPPAVAASAEGTYHLTERRFGRFERSFTLLQSVISDDIRAGFNGGVLTVTLPKTAEAKPRRIQIEQGKNVEIGTRSR